MSVIQLPVSTVKLITSAQIITSVSSIVKELVENAIDAGSVNIDVKLENNGLGKVEVKDDGCGINRSDVENVCRPSFTSKIRDFSDLESLQSYGFRGEALSALCQVADVSITTRTEHDEYAMTFFMDKNGEISDSKISAHGVGTQIIATNLFANLPVRKQYLNSGRRAGEELKRVESTVKSLAVIHPALRVGLFHNRNVVWQKTTASSLKQSFMQAVGHGIASKLQQLSSDDNEVCIEILVPKADCVNLVAQSHLEAIMLFVNKRPVRMKKLEKLLMKHINVQFDQQIPSGKYPHCLVSIDLASSQLDVNLEPNKSKVLFKEENAILDSIEQLLLSYYHPKKEVERDLLNELYIPEQPSKKPKLDISKPTTLNRENETGNLKNSFVNVMEIPESYTLSFSPDENVLSTITNSFIEDRCNKSDPVIPTKRHHFGFTSSALPNNSCQTINTEKFQDEIDDLFDPENLQEVTEEPRNRSYMNYTNAMSNQDPTAVVGETTEGHGSSVKPGLGPEGTAKEGGKPAMESFWADIDWGVEFKKPTEETVEERLIEDVEEKLIEKVEEQQTEEVQEMLIEEKIEKNLLDRRVAGLSIKKWSMGKVKAANGRALEGSCVLVPPGVGTPTSQHEQSVSSQMGQQDQSAFTKFSREIRPMILQAEPGISFTKVAGLMAKRWKELKAEERARWEEEARESNEDKRRRFAVKEAVVQDPKVRKSKIEEFQRLLNKSVEASAHLKKVSSDVDRKERHVDVSLEWIASGLTNRVKREPSLGFTILGRLNTSKVWLYRLGSELGVVRHWGLQEVVLYDKMMKDHSVPLKPADDVTLVDRGVLGTDLWHVLMSLERSYNVLENNVFITSPFISKNGFKIRVNEGEEAPCLLTAVPSVSRFYGLPELKEILTVLHEEGLGCPLNKCRPLKIAHYIEADAVRMTREMPNLDRESLEQLLDYWRTHLDVDRYECLHKLPIFQPFHHMQTPHESSFDIS